MSQCTALIVAAGSGERFGGSIPKQYQDLGGVPILRRSVLAFLNHPHIDRVQVVISPAHRDLYDKAVADLSLPEPITGGETRQDSVRLGLEALAKLKKPGMVMIHDAARPLIDAATITAVRKALDKSKGAIAAKPLVDTLKRGKDELIETTIDRQNLWQAHTPQAFHFDAILDAHRATIGAKLTDDAAVAEKAGMTVTLVPSNPDNMKITNPDDLDRAARLMGHNFGDVRTGMGFDVHRLIPGDAIIICGVKIPHNRKAEGHSDADVGLHALVDAILGAMGAGDIGQHFPPSDPQWKGKDSAHFVRHVVGLLSERGGFIAHVDVTLMCEQPRIGPHRDAMVKRMAELLEVTPDRVSVKATTTERLGFTGREEGIAAQAVATLRFPG
ncbi:MAG: bifunctional 2-C-methyl-D-erythritol 4-phosphate cytidylyltransferase/2-C-methyl-D-erythritol 2,4-cyclodiphosphate synthase [Alphaproteobacteria bacterium]|nr:bifunctional 2-C-methyl-D-erythritol 4-phosphate cytidylyltransferase/2-C-methyl-D-erythritol 2,4-cyclodiphosphate synthase [Alphaproteobacteria bacterium]